jgi:protein subunit release factor B
MDKMAELNERMNSLGITEDQFRETFIRSSGPGGQKVNKTSSCVFLVHLPTGLSVKCQQDRSQALNRLLARRILLDRIEKLRTGVVAAKKMQEEKIRRQKRRRSRRAQEKMLQEKHIIAKKKELRAGVNPDEV